MGTNWNHSQQICEVEIEKKSKLMIFTRSPVFERSSLSLPAKAMKFQICVKKDDPKMTSAHDESVVVLKSGL